MAETMRGQAAELPATVSFEFLEVDTETGPPEKEMLVRAGEG